MNSINKAFDYSVIIKKRLIRNALYHFEVITYNYYAILKDFAVY